MHSPTGQLAFNHLVAVGLGLLLAVALWPAPAVAAEAVVDEV